MTTYYAVITGDPGGDQEFRALRRHPLSPGEVAFSFEAENFENDQELDDYFARTFLPLSVVAEREGGTIEPQEARQTFASAVTFANVLRDHAHYAAIRINAADGKLVRRLARRS